MNGAPNGFLGVAAVAIALSTLAILLQPVEAQTMGFALHESPRPVPEISFANGQGEAVSLADFRGKVVLLNIWATWCVPCRREMPTLDRLQAELSGSDFEVVALSVDRQGRRVVLDFYQELGLRQLGTYVDTSGEAPRKLKALGIPTTLLLDRDGNEIGRLAGPAEWDSPEMVSFIRGYIEQQSGAAADELQFASYEGWRPAAAPSLASPLSSSHGKAPPVVPARRH